MYTAERLFFDIETVVNPDTIDLMPDPKAPGNLKDPDKIAQAVEEKKREMIENAALDADYGRIVSIGMMWGDKKEVVFINKDVYPDYGGAKTESEMLDLFWTVYMKCNGTCVGYNILGFDLPYLLRRSLALGVKPSLTPILARYRTEPVTDLMMILYNWGSDKYKGLKQVARLYGLQNEYEEMDGSKVKDLIVEDLIRYQMSDIRLVKQLYDKMNGIYFRHR